MFKFRGQRVDNGEWVVGFYVERRNKHSIVRWIRDIITMVDVSRNSLAIYTGKLDSTGMGIFASFEVDGKMTTGGDVVRYLGLEPYEHAVYYNAEMCSFYLGNTTTGFSDIGTCESSDLTIIAKQGGNNERLGHVSLQTGGDGFTAVRWTYGA